MEVKLLTGFQGRGKAENVNPPARSASVFAISRLGRRRPEQCGQQEGLRFPAEVAMALVLITVLLWC